jgi:hypothetical protein
MIVMEGIINNAIHKNTPNSNASSPPFETHSMQNTIYNLRVIMNRAVRLRVSFSVYNVMYNLHTTFL